MLVVLSNVGVTARLAAVLLPALWVQVRTSFVNPIHKIFNL